MSVLIINSLVFKHWKQLGRKREGTEVLPTLTVSETRGEQECSTKHVRALRLSQEEHNVCKWLEHTES